MRRHCFVRQSVAELVHLNGMLRGELREARSQHMDPVRQDQFRRNGLIVSRIGLEPIERGPYSIEIQSVAPRFRPIRRGACRPVVENGEDPRSVGQIANPFDVACVIPAGRSRHLPEMRMYDAEHFQAGVMALQQLKGQGLICLIERHMGHTCILDRT